MKIGVLSLQGDVREHARSLSDCGVHSSLVRRPSELDAVDALVIPGGESTTISKLARIFNIFEPIQERIKDGMPVYGSCAGMILLAHHIEDAIVGQESFGGLDVTVRRNAFGRQVDSFETDLTFQGITNPPIRAVFIRAPWVEKVGEGVEILAEFEGHPVAVRSDHLFATSFHPELTGDNRIHKFFIEEVCEPALKSASARNVVK